MASQANVDCRIVQILQGGRWQGGPPRRQAGCAMQHLHDPPGIGRRPGLGVEQAFLAGEGGQQRQGQPGRMAGSAKDRLVLQGEAQLQMIAQAELVGGDYRQLRPADLLGQAGGHSLLLRGQPRQNRLPFPASVDCIAHREQFQGSGDSGQRPHPGFPGRVLVLLRRVHPRFQAQAVGGQKPVVAAPLRQRLQGPFGPLRGTLGFREGAGQPILPLVLEPLLIRQPFDPAGQQLPIAPFQIGLGEAERDLGRRLGQLRRGPLQQAGLRQSDLDALRQRMALRFAEAMGALILGPSIFGRLGVPGGEPPQAVGDDFPGQGGVGREAAGSGDGGRVCMNAVIGLGPDARCAVEEALQIAGEHALVGLDGQPQPLPGQVLSQALALPDLEDGIASLGLGVADHPEQRHAIQRLRLFAGEVQGPQSVALQLGAHGRRRRAGFVMFQQGAPAMAGAQPGQPLPVEALGAGQIWMFAAEAIDLLRGQARDAQAQAVVVEIGPQGVVRQLLADLAGRADAPGAQMIHGLQVQLTLFLQAGGIGGNAPQQGADEQGNGSQPEQVLALGPIG